MRTSELIAKLQECQAMFGDLEVAVLETHEVQYSEYTVDTEETPMEIALIGVVQNKILLSWEAYPHIDELVWRK